MSKTKNKYVGIARSEYQFFNCLCYLIDKENIAGKATIYYNGYFISARPISPCLLKIASQLEVRVVFSSEVECEIERDITFIACKLPINYRTLRLAILGRLNFVKIDDGIGSYNGFKSLYTAAKRELKDNTLLARMFPIKYVVSKVIERVFLRERYSSWIDNANYKRSINKITCFIREYSIKKHKELGPIAVFCTQPFIELGVISVNEQDMIIEQARNLAQQQGLDFKVLRHPAEQEYNYIPKEVLSFDGIFEEFLAIYKEDVKLVMSINSSCLISASKIYDIKAFSIKNENIKAMEDDFDSLVKTLFDSSCENYLV